MRAISEVLKRELERMGAPGTDRWREETGYPRHTLAEALADMTLEYTHSDAIAEFGVPIPAEAMWRANVVPHPFNPWGPSEEDEMEANRTMRAESGVPSRYLDVPPDMSLLASMLRGRGVYLSGPVGVGKTWTACAMARAWSDSGREFLFTSSLDLLSRIRSTFDGAESEAAVMARYAGVPLLVVDDLGKEVPTAWALSKLFDIVNKRYESQLPTVYTSQYGLSALGEVIGGTGDHEVAHAIVSRIKGTCSNYAMPGEDRR